MVLEFGHRYKITINSHTQKNTSLLIFKTRYNYVSWCHVMHTCNVVNIAYHSTQLKGNPGM